MDKLEIQKVKNALLSMQRYSWEQGMAAQAFLELGESDLAILCAKEAVVRQSEDGRLALIGGGSAVTDPAACGEALLYAAEKTGDQFLKSAADKMLDWLLNKAPRSKTGAIFHVLDKPQIWVDSFYMSPPFLAAAGYYMEAMEQIEEYRNILFHSEKRIFSHMWDEGSGSFVRKDFWGVGNGWAIAGMTRVLNKLPDNMKKEKSLLIGYIKDVVDGCLPYMRNDGLFNDVIDNPTTFVETNFSQMLAYTIYKGLSGKWLESAYLKHAEKMRQAVHSKVDKFGLVQGVCGAPYFDHSGTAPEGQAFFLLMEAAANEFYVHLNIA